MICFRADANQTIGIGHVMRCLSIADAAKATGHDVMFILADDSVFHMVTDRGFEAFVLHTDSSKMDEELDRWPQIKADYVIVDSYNVSYDYLRKLKQKTNTLIYIDDLAIFPYPVDILINYNAYGTDFVYSQLYSSMNDKLPELVLGPMYTPLRSMFRCIPKRFQPKTIKNVLISTGGSDSEHIALSIIKKAPPMDYTFHLLIGALNGDKDEIEKISISHPNIVLHENVNDMKTLICEMDIAVSAAGSTLYEICACGVPLITYIVADNQISGAEAFERIGLAVSLGDMRNETDPASCILTAINNLSREYKKRVSMGIKMQRMVDGCGACRIVDTITNNGCLKH